ncbi:MAG: DUF2927 domain-containing protein [Alterinioella nitratireducens]|uniref:DUF2927 domain-containing protein n=1 Tax=Alterinioella nitratireducens TaxID=2735915 RepID=UPI0040598170
MIKTSLAILSLAFVAAGAATPVADLPERRGATLPAALPPMAMFGTPRPEASTRSNTEIARDFLELSFEMESGRAIPTLSRFEGPVTVAVAPGAPVTLNRDLERLIARLRAEARIDIRQVAHGPAPASITIQTLPRARMQRAVPQAACFVVPRVSSWAEFRQARRSAGALDWTTLETRERVAIFIPSDVSPQEVRDCLHEEIGQALGPLNDLYRLSDSVFNDDNFHAVLTGFDMLILRTYYDDALVSGMSRAEVAARLPAILSRLNPTGNRAAASGPSRPHRQWIASMEDALGDRLPLQSRIAAAERAVQIAVAQGWSDTRIGFSHFALGRLTLARDANRSVRAFVTAGTYFRRIDPNGIQVAHVNMQLAAFALSAGEADQVLALVGDALPAATRAENASLLATLLMLRAEALELQGRPSEAATVRLDSLGWARYGFGADQAVRERLTEVAALPPQS